MAGQLDRLHAERARLFENVDDVTGAAEADERDLSDAELELIARARHRVDDELDPQIARLNEIEEARERHVRASATLPAPRAPEVPAGSDVPLYRTFAQYARDEMIRRFDNIATYVGPGAREAATERLSRVAPAGSTLSSDVPGIVPAQHLAQILDVISTNRPAVQSFRQIGLTSGKLEFPKIAARPTVAKQAGEKEPGSITKMQISLASVPADTYLGVGDLSWQTVQWSNPDALALWFDLAGEAYAEQTEAAACAQFTPLPAGGAVGSDDLAGWMAAIAAAAGAVFGRTKAVADTIWTDVATGFKLAGMVSVAMPVFTAAGNINLSTAQGTIGGLRLVVSPEMPAATTVVGASRMALAAETPGAPVQLRAIEVSIAGYEVGVVGAFASELIDANAFEKLTPPVVTAAASGGA